MALLIACSSRAEQFAAEILALDPELDIRIAPDVGDVADIDTALVWQPPPGLLRTLPNLKLIVSVGAGVDALVGAKDGARTLTIHDSQHDSDPLGWAEFFKQPEVVRLLKR